MLKPAAFFIIGCLLACPSAAQKQKEPLALDSSFSDYTDLFDEMDALLDSLLQPRNALLINVSVNNRFYTYTNGTGIITNDLRRLTFSPSFGYYDKSGFGISGEASIFQDNGQMNPYQFSLTASYDYQKNKRFITGAALTHFFTKKNLSFYTSPLQNEGYAYFTYRKLWFKPSVAISYGWGSRKAFEERAEKIQSIRLARRGFTRINTKESVIDFTIMASVKHDFYMLDVLKKNDYVRLTPQLNFSSGTQQFGFNQTTNSYATARRTGTSFLYSSRQVSLDNQLYFQPVSLGFAVKTEYSLHQFFIQPQLYFDYYFPAASNNFTTAFLINAGLFF